MATVEVTFTPLPAHVRTARLVAAAVARRSGVDEALLNEVRLATAVATRRAVRTWAGRAVKLTSTVGISARPPRATSRTSWP